MPTQPRLTVILPTYRFDALARQALRSAAMVGSDDIKVAIADNSENSEKHRFLHDLAARSLNLVVYCHPRNIGPYANWLFLLETIRTPFACLAADDDGFLPAYFRAGLDLVANDEGCSAGAGLFISTARHEPPTPLLVSHQAARLEATAVLRMAAYNGQNSIAYAVVRSDVVRAFADYVTANPVKGPFVDYLLSFNLLSTGSYKVDPSAPAYVYDNSAWQIVHAEWRSSAKFYVAEGLPESFQHFFKLHWAVANVHFFESRYRSPSLTTAEAGAIARYLFERLRGEFLNDSAARRREIAALLAPHPRAVRALATLSAAPLTAGLAIYDEFAHIVAAFAPTVAAKLCTFQRDTLDPASERTEVHQATMAAPAPVHTGQRRLTFSSLLRRRKQ